jgi:hypothetical protein
MLLFMLLFLTDSVSVTSSRGTISQSRLSVFLIVSKLSVDFWLPSEPHKPLVGSQWVPP